MSEPTDVTFKPEAPTSPEAASTTLTEADPRPAPVPAAAAKPDKAEILAKAAAAKAAKEAAAPARPLPAPEDIAAWIHGADVPLLGALFEGLTVGKFDTLILQVRKEELIPQHWQVLTDHTPPDDLAFERLPEVGRLRVRTKNQELSRHRLAQLRYGWRELGGRQPARWTVPDLFAAMRRIYEKGHPVDWYALLTATRDVWRDHELPHGKEQLEILWNCLVQVRKSTKK